MFEDLKGKLYTIHGLHLNDVGKCEIVQVLWKHMLMDARILCGRVNCLSMNNEDEFVVNLDNNLSKLDRVTSRVV